MGRHRAFCQTQREDISARADGEGGRGTVGHPGVKIFLFGGGDYEREILRALGADISGVVSLADKSMDLRLRWRC